MGLSKKSNPPIEKKRPEPKGTQLPTTEDLTEKQPELYRTLFRSIPIPLFFRSTSGDYIGCNPAFERFAGRSHSEIIGKDSYNLFPRAWADKELKSDQEIMLSREAQRYEWHLSRTMGGMCDVYVDKAPITDKDETIVGIAGAITDISGVRALEKELACSTDRLESLLNALPVAVVVIDVHGNKIIDLNPLAMVMLGYTREQLVEKNCETFISDGETGQCLSNDPSSLSDRSEGFVTDSKGNQIPVLKSTITTEIDNKKLFLVCFLDISEQKALENRLREMAEMDFLTGIFNRRHFIESAEREMARSKRYDTLVSVLILDIDWFKKINDQFGHAAGDAVLKIVAEICQKTIRNTDTVGRIGGEEFAAILVECEMNNAFIVAERIRNHIASHATQFEAQEIRCTVSIGVSGKISGKDDLETVMKRADAALYEAKQAGRNQTCLGEKKSLPC